MKFSNVYEDALPNPLGLDGELELWKAYWVGFEGTHPSSVASTLKAISFDSFANIKIALRIIATLPVHLVSVNALFQPCVDRKFTQGVPWWRND